MPLKFNPFTGKLDIVGSSSFSGLSGSPSDNAALAAALALKQDAGAPLERIVSSASRWMLPWDAWGSSTTSGTGGASASGFALNVSSGATAGSRGQRAMMTTVADLFVCTGANANSTKFEWNKCVTVSFAFNVVSTSTNAQFFLKIGGNASTSGDLTRRGISIVMTNNALVAKCRGAGGMTTSGTLKTIPTGSSSTTTITLQSLGNGTLLVYVDGVLAETMSGAPLDPDPAGTDAYVAEVLNNADSSNIRVHVSPINISVC